MEWFDFQPLSWGLRLVVWGRTKWKLIVAHVGVPEYASFMRDAVLEHLCYCIIWRNHGGVFVRKKRRRGYTGGGCDGDIGFWCIHFSIHNFITLNRMSSFTFMCKMKIGKFILNIYILFKKYQHILYNNWFGYFLQYCRNLSMVYLLLLYVYMGLNVYTILHVLGIG